MTKPETALASRNAPWGEQPDLRYAVSRVRGLLRPNVVITAPPDGVTFERDVAVMLRDGVRLRVNVFRPPTEGRYPVLMSMHPYGKDGMPKRTWFGYRPPLQYRFARSAVPARFSAWTSWEAPDPGFWVPAGYVVINADSRGFGRSEGDGDVMSDTEALDYQDLIHWAAEQPWSSGAVGLLGVSYLAISQYKVAALGPAPLRAICPWEGFTDVYRDFIRPGGVLEDGFSQLWSNSLKKLGPRVSPDADLFARAARSTERDAFWAGKAAALEAIRVPALVCASFSDHGLHTRGSFELVRRSGGRVWAFTHRGGKWSTFYGPSARAAQRAFFDHFLRGEANGWDARPAVRVEVRHSREAIAAVYGADAWPLPNTEWRVRYLDHGATRDGVVGERVVAFRTDGAPASFAWTVEDAIDVIGPMVLDLVVSLPDADDASLFATVHLVRDGQAVVFEGMMGFGFDAVTRGCLRLSHRALDPALSTEWLPVYSHIAPTPLPRGVPVPVRVPLLPSATRLQRGDVLRLDLAGREPWKRHPLLGQFPAHRVPSEPLTVRVHLGGPGGSRWTLPCVSVRGAAPGDPWA